MKHEGRFHFFSISLSFFFCSGCSFDDHFWTHVKLLEDQMIMIKSVFSLYLEWGGWGVFQGKISPYESNRIEILISHDSLIRFDYRSDYCGDQKENRKNWEIFFFDQYFIEQSKYSKHMCDMI